MSSPVRIRWGNVDHIGLEVHVEAECAFDTTSPFSIPHLLSAFNTLDRNGAFDTHYRDLGRAELFGAEVAERSGAWNVVSRCEPGVAASVLSNLIQFSHRFVAPLCAVSIRGPGCKEPDVKQLARLPILEVPFAYAIALDSDQVAVCIRFESEPPPPAKEKINEFLSAWEYIVAAGGTHDDVDDLSGPLLVCEEGPEWIADEAWLRLSDYCATPSAVVVLLNGLRGVAEEVTSIRSVQVE